MTGQEARHAAEQDGRVFLVTGGTQGIGAACVARLAAGARWCLTARPSGGAAVIAVAPRGLCAETIQRAIASAVDAALEIARQNCRPREQCWHFARMASKSPRSPTEPDRDRQATSAYLFTRHARRLAARQGAGCHVSTVAGLWREGLGRSQNPSKRRNRLTQRWPRIRAESLQRGLSGQIEQPAYERRLPLRQREMLKPTRGKLARHETCGTVLAASPGPAASMWGDERRTARDADLMVPSAFLRPKLTAAQHHIPGFMMSAGPEP